MTVHLALFLVPGCGDPGSGADTQSSLRDLPWVFDSTRPDPGVDVSASDTPIENPSDAPRDPGVDREEPAICLSSADCIQPDVPCLRRSCNREQGKCVDDPYALNNTPCDDGDPCTGDDRCAGGECRGMTRLCVICGDDYCANPQETCATCPEDCGDCPLFEEECGDLLDEDQDGFTDCDDTDCFATPQCLDPECTDQGPVRCDETVEANGPYVSLFDKTLCGATIRSMARVKVFRSAYARKVAVRAIPTESGDDPVRLFVLEGACAAQNCIESATTGSAPQLVFDARAGWHYYLVGEPATFSTGDFLLEVSCP
jgi:hypothetical protein